MATRLEILLDEAELAEIEQAAKAQRLTVVEWVHHVLRRARATEERTPVEDKLRAVRASARYGYPTADIAAMLDEAASGRAAETR